MEPTKAQDARNILSAKAELAVPQQNEIDRVVEILSSEASMISDMLGYHAKKISPVVRSEPLQEATPLAIETNTPLGSQLKDIADRLYYIRVGLGSLNSQVEL